MSTLLDDCFYMRATFELDATEEAAIHGSQTLDHAQTHSSSSLGVLILHSKSAALERERFMGFLRDLLGEDCEEQASCVPFDDLQNMPSSIDPPDVVVLITSDGENAPVELRAWVASWLNGASSDSALICLVAGVYRETAVWHGLHRACNEAGVAFFATGLQNEKSTI